MAITQLSVFLENVPGTLCKAVSAISGAGINIRALSVADTRDFGIMRLIVPDIEAAKEILSDYTATETKVIAVKMEDRTGALKEILQVLEKAGINIEYVYAFAAAIPGAAYVVLRVDDLEHAEDVLTQNNIPTLNDEDLGTLLP